MRRSLVLATTILSLFALSCGRNTVAPDNGSLQMELTVSAPTGDPAHPVTLTMRVTNTSRKPRSFLGNCVAPFIRLTDPEARHVNDLCAGGCPNLACPHCAPMERVVAPGESYVATLQYTGELRDCYEHFPGASGEYRADAEIQAFGPGGLVPVSSSVTFTWTAN